MIYMFFIIIAFIILLTVIISMNAQHGKISERPLRRKIIDDTSNLLFFVIVFCCLFFFSKALEIVLSLTMILTFTLLFVYKTQIKIALYKIFEHFRSKISFYSSLRNSRKLWGRNAENENPKSDRPAQREDIYREYILFFIVFFCQRTVLFIVIVLFAIWSIQNFCTDNNIINIIKQITDQNFLLSALIFLNNSGLIFNCWKFSTDYQAIKEEKYNAQLERVIRRLDRREHDI